MNELELLQRLAERAREDTTCGVATGEVDVSQRVVRRLARQRGSVVDRRLALVLAGACSLSVLSLGVLLSRQQEPDAVSALSRVAVSGTGPNALWRLVQP